MFDFLNQFLDFQTKQELIHFPTVQSVLFALSLVMQLTLRIKNKWLPTTYAYLDVVNTSNFNSCQKTNIKIHTQYISCTKKKWQTNIEIKPWSHSFLTLSEQPKFIQYMYQCWTTVTPVPQLSLTIKHNQKIGSS